MKLGELRPTRSRQPLRLDGPAIEPAAQLSRATMGIPEDSFVVALSMDPASAGDARRFVYFAALLEALHRPVVGLIPEASWNIERAVRWVRKAGPRWSFKVLHEPITACWDAIDLGVSIAAPWVLDRDLNVLINRQTALVRRAHSAGTPILWAGAGQPADLYPGACASLLGCQTDEPRKLAFKAVTLLEDAANMELVRTELGRLDDSNGSGVDG